MRANKKNSKKTFKVDTSTRNLFVLYDQTRDILIRAIELELKHSKTNYAQTRIFYILSQGKNGVTQTDLAKWTLRNLNTVSTLINKMEKEGLVKRAKSKEDGKVYVTITQKGSKIWNEVSERAISLTFSALSEEEKIQLKAIVKKMRTAIRNMLGLDFKPTFLQ